MQVKLTQIRITLFSEKKVRNEKKLTTLSKIFGDSHIFQQEEMLTRLFK